jgi:hypothetical protein
MLQFRPTIGARREGRSPTIAEKRTITVGNEAKNDQRTAVSKAKTEISLHQSIPQVPAP